MAGDAYAQERTIQISGANRTAMVTVSIGKSEDVRTDTSFVDIMVGDPDVADVNPLTDHSLSILGKKIGTTRVSVYAEGKKLIGVFDVEVTYDIIAADQRAQAPLPARQPARSRRSTAASCCPAPRPTPPTARQGGDHRAPVRAGDHQFGRGDVSRSRSCWRCASSRPRARPAASSACSGTVFGGNSIANIGNRTPAGNLPITRGRPSPAHPGGERRRAACIVPACCRRAVRLPDRPAWSRRHRPPT